MDYAEFYNYHQLLGSYITSLPFWRSDYTLQILKDGVRVNVLNIHGEYRQVAFFPKGELAHIESNLSN